MPRSLPTPSRPDRCEFSVADPLLAGLATDELDVLTALARGLSDHEIAAALDLPISALRVRLRSVYRQVGAPDRPAAIAWAITRHLAERCSQRLPEQLTTVELSLSSAAAKERVHRLLTLQGRSVISGPIRMAYPFTLLVDDVSDAKEIDRLARAVDPTAGLILDRAT